MVLKLIVDQEGVMKCIALFFRVFLVLCVVGVLAACARQSGAASKNDQLLAKECQKNVFLQKYNCSLASVQDSAMQNDADAQYALGYMYYYGVGTTQDQQTAMNWINKAAAQGQPQAVQAAKLLAKKTLVKAGDASVSVDKKIAKHGQSEKPALHQSQASSLKRPHVAHFAKQTKNLGLQLMGNRNKASIEAFIRQHGLHSSVSIYKTTYQGSAWYVLIYGNFVNQETAKTALKQLPAKLKSLKPWVRPLKGLQSVD